MDTESYAAVAAPIPPRAALAMQVKISQNPWLKGLNPTVTIGSLLLIVGVVAGLLLFQEQAAEFFDRMRSAITYGFSWYYVLIAALFLFFNGWLAFSRFGRIRLGRQDERPAFGYFSWFAMVFSAGQGIGLIFWSIAEPMFHLQGNPFAVGSMNAEVAETAMRVTFFHWGLHAWSIYCIVALALAYAAFRKDLPLTIRSTLRPVFGRLMDGPWGHAVDILAVLATIFGVATSLGLGAQQINAGLTRLIGLDSTVVVQLGLIAAITLVAVGSAVSGVNRGVKLLSELNIVLSIALILFFFIWGPSRYLVMSLIDATGDYLGHFIEMSFWLDASKQDPAGWDGWKSSWQGWWTVFYWGWWLSWAPFVGVFIARVSRGRTIREFILGVILVPALMTFVWIAAFGGTAVSNELFGQGGIAAAVTNDVASAFFATVDSMQLGGLGTVALWLGTILIATYFITSADSATLVLTTIMSHGGIHPAKRHRVFWGGLQGLVAAVLLVVGGTASLATLQTAAIASALPFSLIMLLMCWSLAKALHAEDPLLAPA
jgi:choline/glycine/proline betaine transport protein